MKECPICGARAFDDAEVCYGCLHHYGDEGGGDAPSEEQAILQAISNGADNDTPPAFTIKFTPSADESGGVKWTCAIEMENTSSCCA